MAQNACAEHKQNFTNYDMMLCIYETGLAKAFDLKATTFNVLFGLCRYYNQSKGVVFPSIETLAEKLNLGERTVTRAIGELVKKGLILKTRKGNKNFYGFGGMFWAFIQNDAIRSNRVTGQKTQATRQTVPTLPARLAAKQNNHEKNKEHSSSQNDDVFLKISTNEETEPPETKTRYAELMQKFEKWGFVGGQFIIKKHGLERIEGLCRIIEEKQPANKGAYLRRLLELPEGVLTQPTRPEPKRDLMKERTQAMLAAQSQVERTSPLDWDRDAALSWCQSLPQFLRARSGIFADCVSKWDFAAAELL